MGTYVCFNTGSASHNCLDDDIFNICLIELGRHCLQRDHTNNTWTQFHAFCDPNNSDLSLEKYLWFIRMSVSIICLFQLYLNAIFSQLFQPLFVKICILYVCVCVFLCVWIDAILCSSINKFSATCEHLHFKVNSMLSKRA